MSDPQDKAPKHKNLIDQIREVDAQERAADEERERAEREKRQLAEKAAQEAYERRLRKERIELMQLKQGVVQDPKLVKSQVKEVRVYTPKEKISNFFYHNKLYIILVTVLAAIAILFIHDMVTAIRPDANVMIICTDALGYKTEEMQQLFESIGIDYNEDGEISIPVTYSPSDDAASDDPTIYQANVTKLVGEIQVNDSLMLIGKEADFKRLDMMDYLVDFKELYPNQEWAGEMGIQLSKTGLSEKVGLASISDELYLCVQKVSDGSNEKTRLKHENALAVVDKFVQEVG